MKGEKNGCISDKKGAWKNMTKETDKISVIVPVYNVKNYLEDCVQSITHQTYPDLEILLIDDGSDDGSEDGDLSADGDTEAAGSTDGSTSDD